MPDDLPYAQIAIFFWAGYETTGNAMSWTMFLISQHPEVSPHWQNLAEHLLHVQIAIFLWAGCGTMGNTTSWTVFLIS